MAIENGGEDGSSKSDEISDEELSGLGSRCIVL
jgi:hypothetical protein